MNMLPKFLLNAFKSGGAILLGGALGVGLLMSLLFRMGGKMGKTYLILAMGGVVLIFLLLGVVYLIWRFREKRRKEKMEGALSQESNNRQHRRQEEKIAVNDLNKRWTEAIKTLKNSNVDLYQLPWILLIGEPRSGKTTTLAESGLDFFMGKGAVPGAGGTVNCDWWFTSEAVIVDTAGRFTMPVDSAPDSKEWQAFLHLLTKHRPLCPINGVIVTIPADSLLRDPSKEIQDKAYKIREKLQELSTVLKVEFPIYIMISKLDLVHGFAEFCDSLSTRERAQVLGWNRKKIAAISFDAREFSNEFDHLINRFRYWSFRRLKEMKPGVDSDGVYAFPSQFEQIRENLGRYLGLIFAEDPYHTPFLWRGCFFSSGLQEGKTIANALMGGQEDSRSNLMNEFAGSFLKSRSYFITEFYNKVFRERGHVKRSGRAKRREIISRFMAAGLALIFFLGMGCILYPGYKSLNGIVTPLNEEVKNVGQLLMSEDRSFSEERLDKVLTIFQTLEKGRNELAGSGVKLFLKGRENQLVKNIGQIQDALVEKELILMSMVLSGEHLSGSWTLKTNQDEEVFLAAMGAIMEVLGGKSANSISIDPLININSGPESRLTEAQRLGIVKALEGYPYGDFAGRFMARTLVKDAPIRNELFFNLLRGLSKLRNYWNTYGTAEWLQLKKQVADIERAYLAILAVKPDETITGNHYKNKIEGFKEFTLALTSEESGHFIWPETIPEKCETCYDFLLSKGLGTVSETLKRHAGVCNSLSRKVTIEWPRWLGQNDHILSEKGQISEQLKLIQDALDRIALIEPFFDPEKKNRINRETEDPISLLNIWSLEWNKTAETIEAEIENALTPVTAMGWEKDRLLEDFSVYLRSMIWEADRDAVKEAISVVFSSQSALGGGRIGGESPQKVRTGWILQKHRILDGLYHWLKSKHPQNQDLASIRAGMGTRVANAQYQLMKYWSGAIEAHDPGQLIRRAKTWKTFRDKVLSMQGLFLDPGARPLSSFLTNVSIDGLDQIKKAVEDSGTAFRFPSDFKKLELRVRQAIYLYTNPGYLGALDQSQIDFIEGVRSQETRDQGDGSGAMLDALSGFKERVWRDSRVRGETLTYRLASIEKQAKKLLRGHLDKQFSRDWDTFISNWQSVMGNRFPFGSTGSWDQGDMIAGHNFQMVTLKDLHDFYFSESNGLNRLEGLYHLSRIKGMNEKRFGLDDSQVEFILNCIAWKSFIFDPQGNPKKHRVEVILDDSRESIQRAAGMFTSLRFKGLKNESGNQFQLRFSGNRHKRKEISWDPRSIAEIRIEARHVEKTSGAGVTISGGAFSLPAFILDNGLRGEGKGLNHEWIMEIQLPDILQSGIKKPDDRTFIPVPIKFVWDEDIPDNIIWPL